jgi:hypothetical protein
MTIGLILSVVLSTAVIVAIVGGLSWSIATQDLDGVVGLPHRARRRRRPAARALGIGRTAEHRG